MDLVPLLLAALPLAATMAGVGLALSLVVSGVRRLHAVRAGARPPRAAWRDLDSRVLAPFIGSLVAVFLVGTLPEMLGVDVEDSLIMVIFGWLITPRGALVATGFVALTYGTGTATEIIDAYTEGLPPERAERMREALQELLGQRGEECG